MARYNLYVCDECGEEKRIGYGDRYLQWYVVTEPNEVANEYDEMMNLANKKYFCSAACLQGYYLKKQEV